MRTGSTSENDTVTRPATLAVLPLALRGAFAARADGPLLGEPLLVGLAVGTHAPLGLGRRVVDRRGIGAPVVLQLLVEHVFVRSLIAHAPPVDGILLLLPLPHLLLEPVALAFEFGERLHVDEHALHVGTAPHGDLRADENDHQHEVGDQRDAETDAMVVGPCSDILPTVVERKSSDAAAVRAAVCCGGVSVMGTLRNFEQK